MTLSNFHLFSIRPEIFCVMFMGHPRRNFPSFPFPSLRSSLPWSQEIYLRMIL